MQKQKTPKQAGEKDQRCIITRLERWRLKTKRDIQRLHQGNGGQSDCLSRVTWSHLLTGPSNQLSSSAGRQSPCAANGDGNSLQMACLHTQSRSKQFGQNREGNWRKLLPRTRSGWNNSQLGADKLMELTFGHEEPFGAKAVSAKRTRAGGRSSRPLFRGTSCLCLVNEPQTLPVWPEAS